jgi:hypothetical protein
VTRRSPAVATVAFVVALVASPAAATGAQVPSPPAAGAAAAGAPSLLRLLGRTPWVGDSMDFELTVQTLAAPEGSQLQVTVHDRVRSRSEFARSLEGTGLRRRLSGPAPVPLALLDADGDGAVPLLVPLVPREGATVAPITTPGVYPVVVELLSGADDVIGTLHTHLVRLATPDPAADPEDAAVPLGAAVVVPLHGLPIDLDASEPVPVGGPVERVDTVAAALAAHPDVPVNLAATPQSIAAVAGEDPDATDALSAVLAGSEVLEHPWVVLDEAAWQRADEAALVRQLARGRHALAVHLDGEPSPTRLVRAGSPVEEVATMAAHGATAVVVQDADLEPLDTRDFPYTVARPFELALTAEGDDGGEDEPTVRALAGDEDLAALALGAEDDPILAAHQVLADLAVIAEDEPESPRVATLVLPAAAAGSAAFLDELLAGLEPPVSTAGTAPPAPAVVGTTLEAGFGSVEPAGADGGADADEPLVRRLATDSRVGDVSVLARRLHEAAADLVSLRSVFGATDPTAARIEVVLATAAATGLDTAQRQMAFSSSASVAGGRLSGLHPPERQQVRLTDREGRIQLVLGNSTGTSAAVNLVLRGDRLVFPDVPDGVMTVQLTEPVTRVDLRVEARSSGDAPLDIRLTSPDGRLLLGTSRITVRTTAVSGVGLVLMGASVAFLAVWWTRTILRERRASRRRHPAHLRRA